MARSDEREETVRLESPGQRAGCSQEFLARVFERWLRMTATEQVREAVRTASPWIERTARLGYVCIGIVYIVIGFMTAAAAAGLGGSASSWSDAIVRIGSMPLGTVALIVIAVGLAGYSAWLVSSAINDSDRRGSDLKGLAMRAGNVGSAVIHAAIALSVARFAMTRRSSGSGGEEHARHWTASVMDVPFGRWAVAVAGLVLIGAGVFQLYRAWEAKLSKRLHIERVAGRGLLVAICRLGMAARGVILAVIGWSLVIAALHRDAANAHATKGALQQVGQTPFGAAVLVVVSIGVAAYGIYAIVKARYRIVRAT